MLFIMKIKENEILQHYYPNKEWKVNKSLKKWATMTLHIINKLKILFSCEFSEAFYMTRKSQYFFFCIQSALILPFNIISFSMDDKSNMNIDNIHFAHSHLIKSWKCIFISSIKISHWPNNKITSMNFLLHFIFLHKFVQHLFIPHSYHC